MVNPVKFLYKATGLQNILDPGGEAPSTAPAPAQVATPAPPPSPAPIVGQEPTPNKPQKKMKQFAPSIIGGATSADSGTGGKTLLGQ